MPRKSEVVSGFAWASVLVLPWLWIVKSISLDWLSGIVWIFFLVVAILSSTIQVGVDIRSNK